MILLHPLTPPAFPDAVSSAFTAGSMVHERGDKGSALGVVKISARNCWRGWSSASSALPVFRLCEAKDIGNLVVSNGTSSCTCTNVSSRSPAALAAGTKGRSPARSAQSSGIGTIGDASRNALALATSWADSADEKNRRSMLVRNGAGAEDSWLRTLCRSTIWPLQENDSSSLGEC